MNVCYQEWQCLWSCFVLCDCLHKASRKETLECSEGNGEIHWSHSKINKFPTIWVKSNMHCIRNIQKMKSKQIISNEAHGIFNSNLQNSSWCCNIKPGPEIKSSNEMLQHVRYLSFSPFCHRFRLHLPHSHDPIVAVPCCPTDRPP